MKKFFVALVGVLLVACGGSSDKPEDSVKGLLDNLKKGEFTKAADYIEKSGRESFSKGIEQISSNEQIKPLVDVIFSEMSYKILETKTEGDKATVKLEMTNVKFTDVVQKIQQELTAEATALQSSLQGKTPEEMQKIQADFIKKMFDKVKEQAKKSDAPKSTGTAELKLVKEDKKWVITQPDSTFQQALLPGGLPGMN